ncbi:SET domain-containing protein, partial [Saitoella complicata NRRL Y-17804]
GICALRDFDAGSLIVEYRGEVISTEECQRRTMERMKAAKAKAKEATKGKGKVTGGGEDHYFLALHKSTMIDAHTRANEGRFANHSCSPNAKVEKWYVRGEPRVGIFACEKGVGVGEEITYDYCFEWFEGAVEQECRCGAVGCRGFI